MAHPIRRVTDLEPHQRESHGREPVNGGEHQRRRGGPAALPVGWWRVDPARSWVGFAGRYLSAITVRGSFTGFCVDLLIASPLTDSAAVMTIDAATISTGVPLWDAQLRSPELLDVTRYPTITFRSTSVAVGGPGWRVSGELTVREITRPLIVDVVVGGVTHDRATGATRVGLRATVRVDRARFGLNAPTSLPGGGQCNILALDLTLNATRLNRDLPRPAAA